MGDPLAFSGGSVVGSANCRVRMSLLVVLCSINILAGGERYWRQE